MPSGKISSRAQGWPSALSSMVCCERRKAHAAGLGVANRAAVPTAADTPIAVAADAQCHRELNAALA